MQQTLEVGDVQFCGAVLHLRGVEGVPNPQPINLEHAVILFNGEVFDGIDIAIGQNDVQIIAELINQKLSQSSTLEQSASLLLDVLNTIRGPFSVIVFVKSQRHLLWAKDRMGRRSFVVCHSSTHIALCSVPISSLGRWYEVQPSGVYGTDLSAPHPYRSVSHWPYSSILAPTFQQLQYLHSDINPLYSSLASDFVPLPQSLPSTQPFLRQLVDFIFSQSSAHISAISSAPLNSESVIKQLLSKQLEPLDHSTRLARCSLALLHCLSRSLCRRLLSIPALHSNPLCILFSGGIDCTLLAAMCALVLPPNCSVDLINCAFVGNRKSSILSPDRIAARHSFNELKSALIFSKILSSSVTFSHGCKLMQCVADRS